MLFAPLLLFECVSGLFSWGHVCRLEFISQALSLVENERLFIFHICHGYSRACYFTSKNCNSVRSFMNADIIDGTGNMLVQIFPSCSL